MSYSVTCNPSGGSLPFRINTPVACSLEGLSPQEREQTRSQVLQAFHLLTSDPIPVFDEAVQSNSRLVSAPICLISVMDEEYQWVRAAVGLSHLGLMNPLAAARKLPRDESFAAYVVDSQKNLLIENTCQHPALFRSELVQRYGIQAYAGIPLMTSQGICLGVLEVMDVCPRQFSARDVALMEMNARWSVSELERGWLQRQLTSRSQKTVTPAEEAPLQKTLHLLRLKLIAQLTQDLRNPLTSIMGMAGMLSREIYGPLTDKQKEYADIVRNSSQKLLSLVDEIIDLGTLEDERHPLDLGPVDLEMLGQQIIKPLEHSMDEREQMLEMSVEPSSRIATLDKQCVRQLLYHLIFNVIQISGEGSKIRIHASRKANDVQIAVWTSNPWLGEGLPSSVLSFRPLLSRVAVEPLHRPNLAPDEFELIGMTAQEVNRQESLIPLTQATISREGLGVLLSRQLAELHGGSLSLQGSPESGYRYVVSLPQPPEEFPAS